MQFIELLHKINSCEIRDNRNNKKINNICLNSKFIKKDDLFISIKGKRYKKNNFLNEAIKNGSKAIITDSKYLTKRNIVPVIFDKDIRKKLPDLLNHFYQDKPSNVVAVTGTNGKTSVCWYVYQILLLSKINISYVGTIGQFYNNRKISSLDNTTPDICSLFRLLNEHFKMGSNNFIFEASSHGLDQNRISGLPINIAAITNITNDHLDYHGSFNSYKNTKLKLFTKYLEKKGKAIINSNIQLPKGFKKYLKNKSISVITYGKPNSEIYIKHRSEKISIKIFNKFYRLPSNFRNKFNIQNFECAITILICLGIKKEIIFKNLIHLFDPPGRMEKCTHIHNNSKVYIDFAHTPDALKNALISLNSITGKKPNLIFGCGGERDKSKRKIMGKIARLYANRTYITDDNPRKENPQSIRLSIFQGCPGGQIIEDRKIAINIAINSLKEEEVLLIAGKGHEKYQIINEKKIDFDDLEIANRVIEKKNQESKNNYFNLLQDKIVNCKGTIKIDSREIKKGDIFLTLKGSMEHGERYIEDAIKNKASYVITENKNATDNDKIIQVGNCIKALEYIAKYKRANYSGKIIGITGSSGKTSTKEQLRHFLSFELKVQYSIKSYNNFLGVNLSLANLDMNSSVSIFEIGTNNFGEISKLTSIVKPHIAIITNIGPTHLKNFSNTYNVAKEKSDIYNTKINPFVECIILPYGTSNVEYLNKKASKVKNCEIIKFGANEKANIHTSKIEKKNNGNFLVQAKVFSKKLKYIMSVNGEHQISNNLIVLSVFHFLKLNLNNISKYAPSLPKLSGRGKLYNLMLNDRKVNLIDDSYNANPMSMQVAIDYFAKLKKNSSSRKFLVLGDMLELGKKEKYFHQKISKYLNLDDFFQVILCGNLIKQLYNFYKSHNKLFYLNNEKKLYNHILDNIGNNDIILAKGSNATPVNKFVSRIKMNMIK